MIEWIIAGVCIALVSLPYVLDLFPTRRDPGIRLKGRTL